MPKYFILLLVLFTHSFVNARTIRFWEGDRNNRPKGVAETEEERRANVEAHLEFIRNSLAPGTVVAGQGGLDYYLVYIPTDKPFAQEASITELPFSEAALPSYYCKAAYDKARARRPLYGPLHSKRNGFGATIVEGQRRSSYSSTPKEFEDSELESGVSISNNVKEDRSDRIAYDLTPRTLQPLTNWQQGTSLVWLQVRKPNVTNNQYRTTLARLFHRLVSKEQGIDGHFARVDSNHVLHFIHLNHKTQSKDFWDSNSFKALENLVEDVVFTQDKVTAIPMEPFYAKNPKNLSEPNWDSQIAAGKAVVVKFIPRAVTELLSEKELDDHKECKLGLR